MYQHLHFLYEKIYIKRHVYMFVYMLIKISQKQNIFSSSEYHFVFVAYIYDHDKAI